MASALVAGVPVVSGVATAAAAEPSHRGVQGTFSTIRPNGALSPAAPVSAAERDRLARRNRRDPTASNRGAGRAVGADTSPETTAWAGSKVPSVTRNNRNNVAQFLGSRLAEPAAASDGAEVFFGGNTYFSRSVNNGTSFTYEAIPGGPADAPIACCDVDTARHNGLDTTFISVLYLNSARTNGVVRIFVRRGTISGGADCSYDVDPGGSSAVLPDYPHLAVSNNFVYLTTNNLATGSQWTGAQIRRFNASQMANCQSVGATTLNYVGSDGQRVLTPVENASTTMYFGLNRSANLFRILRLPESSSTLSQFDRTLSHGTSFPAVEADCRGGVGNLNWMHLALDISGFDLHGAVVPGDRLWFLWNAGGDSSHPQAHLHSAIFSEPGLTTFTSPAVWSSGQCFAYPALGANALGEFGLTFAEGGRAGGGGGAAQGAIAVDDSQSAGNTFPSFTVTAGASHNPVDGRFGDYFTIRRNNKCFGSYGWSATNYGLAFGNTSSSNVNARYVEFQSSTRPACP